MIERFKVTTEDGKVIDMTLELTKSGAFAYGNGNSLILKEGERAAENWKKALRAGSTVTPVEFARMAGVDITTDGPLLDTIELIGAMIDEMYTLTDELGF